MALDQAKVEAVSDAVLSVVQRVGFLRRAHQHEVKGLPGTGLTAAFWLNSIEPIGQASGLAACDGYLTYQMQVYGNALTKPENQFEARMAIATAAVLAAYSEDFTLGGVVRAVDLLGMYGMKLGAKAGYITIQNTTYRITQIDIPCIVNDMWTEVP